MKSLFIDCHTGVAGDMLLSALIDLGVPKTIIEAPLYSLGLGKSFSLRVEEGHSSGIRGKRVYLDGLKPDDSPTNLKKIVEIVEDCSWENALSEKVLNVFSALAKAEALVHGKSVQEIHFHELGSLDALIEVVCVCAAIEMPCTAVTIPSYPT